MQSFIVLFMVCAPSLVVVNSPKAAGRRILNGEFIDDKFQAYKLEIWDETKIPIIHQILKGIHDAASTGSYSCPVGFPLASDNGMFIVKPCLSDYDKAKGYRFVITTQKDVRISEDTVPSIPSQARLIAYLKDNGITKPLNEWNKGYTVKMYTPYHTKYNLQQVVAVESIRAVTTKNGMRDLLEVHLISGVPKEGSIKLSLWGDEAHLMHDILKSEYENNTTNSGGPIVWWHTLDLYDAHASCYLDKYQGNLVISKKLNSPPFEPPQFVTPGHVEAFIEKHGLLPIEKWNLDKPSVGSPTAMICTVTSPSFDSAAFLRKQQERLMNLSYPCAAARLHFENENDITAGTTTTADPELLVSSPEGLSPKAVTRYPGLSSAEGRASIVDVNIGHSEVPQANVAVEHDSSDMPMAKKLKSKTLK